MKEDNHLYDFSEYPEDNLCYDISNKKVLGKFKDEMKSKIVTEFIALKPKMYSFNYDNKNIHKCKGIKKSIDIKFNEHKQSLINEELIFKEFYNFQLSKQNIYLNKNTKITLNSYDSKRYWIDNINSVPYGYSAYSI